MNAVRAPLAAAAGFICAGFILILLAGSAVAGLRVLWRTLGPGQPAVREPGDRHAARRVTGPARHDRPLTRAEADAWDQIEAALTAGKDEPE